MNTYIDELVSQRTKLYKVKFLTVAEFSDRRYVSCYCSELCLFIYSDSCLMLDYAHVINFLPLFLIIIIAPCGSGASK